MAFRIKCFLLHLLISAIFAGLSFWLVFDIWYIPPLSDAIGVGRIVFLILVVDVILGPILTLILARQGKKGLKTDFLLIAVVQITALLYGLYSLERGRPVWIAFDLNRFELVQKYMVERKPNEKFLLSYQREGWLSPDWVAVRPAKDRQEQDDWLFYELETGISPAMKPVLYQSVDKNMDRIMKEKSPLIVLNQYNDRAIVELILAQYPQADGFLPMRASELDMTVLVDSRHQKILGIVNLRPWN